MPRRRVTRPDHAPSPSGHGSKLDALTTSVPRRNCADLRAALRRSEVVVGRIRVSIDPVLALDIEVRAANRPGQLRLLWRELERAKLGGDLHPFGELEPDRSPLRFVNRIRDVDREPVLVEHLGQSDVLDPEGCCLKRGRSDHHVALLFADAMHPLDGLRGLGGRFDREHEVVGQWWRR